MSDPSEQHGRQSAAGVGFRRALILKPCCLGDVLLATPLLRALASAWPDSSIDWAVDDHSRAAIANNPRVSTLVDATGCVPGTYRAGRLLGLARTLRRQHYDAVFVPDRSPVTSFLARLSAAPLRVGLDSGGRGRFNTVRVPVDELKHEADLYLDLARAIGLESTDPRPAFHVSDDDREKVRKELGAGNGLLMAIHPGGGINPGMRLTEKRWPAERYGALAARVSADWGARVVILGDQNDQPSAAEVVAVAGGGPINLAGHLTLSQTAAAIELSDLYVGNDTGVTILATAVNTPVVAIFGPTDPRRYGPLQGMGIAVSPPGQPVDSLTDALGSQAIELITLDQVLSALRTVAAQARVTG